MSILARPETTTGAWSTADVLRAIADRVDGANQPPVNVRISIQYSHGNTVAVDATAKRVAMPLPTTREVGGTWQHTSTLERDGMTVIAFCGVEEPAAAKRARLARELEELDALIGGTP
jgi:hypothetical protein